MLINLIKDKRVKKFQSCHPKEKSPKLFDQDLYQENLSIKIGRLVKAMTYFSYKIYF